MGGRRALFPLVLLVLCAACGAPKKGKGTPPERYCPGGPGCEKGSDGVLKAGVAAAKITPAGFERPKLELLKETGDGCPETTPLAKDGLRHCGPLTGGTADFFLDCGRDQLCPGDQGYAAPDADGSEGDGKFQGMWIAGFSSNKPAVDVHDDLWARAVVLSSGDVSIAIASVDAVGLFNDDVQRIRALVAQRAPELALDYILVSSTHTHEGPDTLGQWGPSSNGIPTARGVDEAWFSKTVLENTAQAIVDAARSARPAKVFAAQPHLGATTAELISDTRDPFVSDDAVTALAFKEAATGEPIGTLVSWGNHPETVGSGNNSLSSDFAWALREGMEKGLYTSGGDLVAAGAGGTCVYVNGAVGGMQTSLHSRPVSLDGTQPRDNTFAKARAVGETVAKLALAALTDARELKSPALAYGAQSVQLTVENETFQLAFIGLNLLKRKLYEFDREKPVSPTNMPKVMTEVAKIELGPVRFLAVPGELLPELAIGYDPAFAFGQPQVQPGNPNPPDLAAVPPPPYLNEQLGGDFACVFGLANDELGYLIPPYDYKLDAAKPFFDQAPGDHYEETNSLGPSAVPTLLEAYRTLLSWEPG
ncbi:MAG: hypothetical protein ACYC8T_06440 [Myxococcaceae bacterium]